MHVSISGVTGVGKSTVVTQLVEHYGFARAVSTTTRLPRAHEQHGVDYYFVTRDAFHSNDMIEHMEYLDHLYGTSKAEFARLTDVKAVFDLHLVDQTQAHLPNMLWILLEHGDLRVLEQRIIDRKLGDQITHKRLQQLRNTQFRKADYDLVIDVSVKTPIAIADEIWTFVQSR